MGKKYLLLAIVAVVAFGLGVSGCNRNGNRTAARTAPARSGQAKPAEVLSASSYKPTARDRAPLPPPAQPAQDIYAMSPPAPQYVQTQYTPALAMAQAGYAAPAPVAYTQPVAYAQPVAYSQPAPVMHMTSVPPPAHIARAPIPELEPSRSYNLPTRRSSSRPVAEVMISERTQARNDRQEVNRALAPIAQVQMVEPPKAWVASPITAMSPGRALY